MDTAPTAPPYTRLLKAVMVLLWIGYGLTAASLVLVTVMFGTGYATILPLHAEVDADHAAMLFPQFGERVRSLEIEQGGLELTEADPMPRLAWMGALMLVFALMLGWFGLQWLQGIVRSYAADNPFDPQNARRLRNLAYLLLTGAVLADFVISPLWMAQTGSLLDSPRLHPIVDVDISGTVYITAMLLLMLAQVFKRGAQLQHENDLTV